MPGGAGGRRTRNRAPRPARNPQRLADSNEHPVAGNTDYAKALTFTTLDETATAECG
jgi:hypothetical protein